MDPVNVLVVDDEPLILRLLGRLLSAWGAAVEVADGPTGLRLLGEREFALVISDTQMPDADGIEVLNTAKRVCPKSIRVLMSGNPDALARGHCDDSPAHHLLNKPIDRARLRQLYEIAARATTRLDDLTEAMAQRYADSRDSVFVKDTKGRYLFMNAAGAALLQRPVHEILGRLDSEIFDRPTLLEEVRASDQEVLRTGNRYLYLNATRTPGTARSFMSVKFPVYHASGLILAIGCLSRDVTELMELAPADRAGKIEVLVHDLREASSILAAGESAVEIDRSEIESLLESHADAGDTSAVLKSGGRPHRGTTGAPGL